MIDTAQDMVVKSIPVEEIYMDIDFNCRGEIIPYDVTELANSIEKVGLQQPIAIQPYDKVPPYKYRVVLGHRRLRAFQIKKYQTIPAIIKEGLSDTDARVLNLKENIERKDLNILQEALALQKFHDAGYTMKEVADLLGVSSGWVQSRYNLLRLDPAIQDVAAAGFLTQEQIKDIYGLDTKEEQLEAVKEIKERRQKGDKKAIKVKSKEKNPQLKQHRKRKEIFLMIDFIIDEIGANFGTRCLAWAAGEVSDHDLFKDIKQFAEEQGVDFKSQEDEYYAKLQPM